MCIRDSDESVHPRQLISDAEFDLATQLLVHDNLKKVMSPELEAVVRKLNTALAMVELRSRLFKKMNDCEAWLFGYADEIASDDFDRDHWGRLINATVLANVDDQHRGPLFSHGKTYLQQRVVNEQPWKPTAYDAVAACEGCKPPSERKGRSKSKMINPDHVPTKVHEVWTTTNHSLVPAENRKLDPQDFPEMFPDGTSDDDRPGQWSAQRVNAAN